MTDLALHVRFPGTDFLSLMEFDNFCRDNQAVLDARFAYEQRLAEDAEIREGSCAPCLAATRFGPGAGGHADWRDGQICDCPDRLGNRARGMLHFLESVAGLDAWSRILLFGPPSPLDARLAAGRRAPERRRRLVHATATSAQENQAAGHDGWQLDVVPGAFTHVLAWDYLHHVPPLRAALAEIRVALAPGGQFVFTLPFHYRARATLSHLGHVPRRGGRLPAEFRGEIHDIGWDILDMLRAAGFTRALVHHYWSDELGYLGAFNLLFSAAA